MENFKPFTKYYVQYHAADKFGYHATYKVNCSSLEHSFEYRNKGNFKLFKTGIDENGNFFNEEIKPGENAVVVNKNNYTSSEDDNSDLFSYRSKPSSSSAPLATIPKKGKFSWRKFYDWFLNLFGIRVRYY